MPLPITALYGALLGAVGIVPQQLGPLGPGAAMQAQSWRPTEFGARPTGLALKRD